MWMQRKAPFEPIRLLLHSLNSFYFRQNESVLLDWGYFSGSSSFFPEIPRLGSPSPTAWPLINFPALRAEQTFRLLDTWRMLMWRCWHTAQVFVCVCVYV